MLNYVVPRPEREKLFGNFGELNEPIAQNDPSQV